MQSSEENGIDLSHFPRAPLADLPTNLPPSREGSSLEAQSQCFTLMGGGQPGSGQSLDVADNEGYMVEGTAGGSSSAVNVAAAWLRDTAPSTGNNWLVPS